MVLEIGSELFYQIIYSIGIAAAAFIATRIVGRSLAKFAERTKLEEHTTKPINRLISAVIYIVAFLFLLGVWGLRAELTGLLASAGFAGIVIGFATKDIFEDLLSGIMLFFDRPFKIGHVINIGDLWGTVKDIGIRSTKIRTFDGKFVTIPNSRIAKSTVTNVSVYEGRRLELEVGVDYDTDLKKARKAIERAVKKLQKEGKIREEPKEKILLKGFGESSINFKVLFWYNPEYTKEKDLWFAEIKGDLIEEIKKEFDRAKISIPFPQITLSERRKKKV